ncbi:MAG: InlB B-repeat-containing protein, partial [Oscillospiraceae bacterium]
MKISRLRRALAVLLSAAMLIMCMPTVGITAAAVTDTTSCLYVTIPGTEDITTLEEATAKVPESEWTSGTLTEALKVANKPHYNKTVYIKLLSDVTAENYGKTIIFSSYEGNTVFDLNGNTVDGGNGYRCIQISEDYGISKPITITSSAAQRGTITNGMSKSAGAGGIDQNSGKLLLSNLDIINNQTSGMYAAGFYAYGNSTTLSNVKITGNKSLNSNDAYGGVMTYCPFTFKGKVEITGNGNNLGSNNRDLWIVSKGDKSSVSGLTAGSNISLYNPNNKGFTVSSDGGNNPDIYNYFSIANSGFWISPTSSGGIQVTNSVYGVVFDMQGKTDNVVNTVSSGAKATKPSDPTASDGSTFGGWYKDKECTEEFDFTAAITQNTTVYAKWEAPARITITLDPNGGTLSGGATATTNANGTFDSLPAEPTREGYTFGGWYTHATEGKKVTTSTQLDDGDTIYAQWIDELGDGSNPVSVTLLDDAKLNPAENDNTGTKFVFTGIPKLNKAEIDAGFRYIYVVLPIDWYSKEQLENMVANTNNGLKDKDRYDYLLSPSEMENIPSDNTITVTTLSAVQLYKINDHSYKYSVFFEQDCYNIFAEKDFAVGKAAAPAEYTITFDTKGGALPEGTKSTATTTDGKLAELPTPTRDGYVFDGWFDAETGGKEVTTETKFEDNATIYAQWTYAKLDNNVYLAMDDDKMDEFVSKMIVGEDFDSEDVSDLFTIEKNSELFTLSAVLTDWDGKTSGTYTYGTKYYAKVKISPKSGYTFEDITKVTIHVGKYPITPKVNSSENYVELSQTLGYPHYEVEDVSVDEVQVNVDTSNLTLTANEKIDDEAVYNCFSVPDDVIYNVYLYGIAYKDAEGNYVAADLDNGDTYAEGKKYYAKLAIALLAPETVMYNYYFADNVTITFGDGTIPFDVSRRTGACIEGYYPIGTVSTAEPP